MSESKTPQAGEWWETRDGERVYVGARRPEKAACVSAPEDVLAGWYTHNAQLFQGSWSESGEYIIGRPGDLDLVKHLPGCTGWDWKEPHKLRVKPDPGKGWRLLESDEKVIQGDEYFEPRGTTRWEQSDNWRSRSGEQSPELVYRRRKEKPPKPVVSVCPYVVSLDTYEKVVAERNALQDRLREIEAKAKFYESVF